MKIPLLFALRIKQTHIKNMKEYKDNNESINSSNLDKASEKAERDRAKAIADNTATTKAALEKLKADVKKGR